MNTLTKVENVERRKVDGRSAAIVTLMGGSKAGTFERELCETAESLVGKAAEVQLRKEDGKTMLVSIQAVPEEVDRLMEEPETNPLDEAEPEQQPVPDVPVEAREPEQAELTEESMAAVEEVGGVLVEIRDLLAVIARNTAPPEKPARRPAAKKAPATPAKKPAAAKKPATRKAAAKAK